MTTTTACPVCKGSGLRNPTNGCYTCGASGEVTITAKLASLFASGALRIDGGEVVGVAADGIEASLGTADDLHAVDFYLSTHPEPKDW